MVAVTVVVIVDSGSAVGVGASVILTCIVAGITLCGVISSGAITSGSI
jgi:hypothetical protein